MPPSFTKKQIRGTTGLDLDGRFAAAVQAAEGRIASAVSTELPDGLIVDGEVRDAAALTEFLRAFFRDNALPKSVRLGVSNQQIVVRRLELPRIEDRADRDAAIRFQAAEAIAMPLEDAVLDHQVVGESVSPDGIARTNVVVAAARRNMIESLVAAVQDAGLKPEGIDLDAFALVRTLASPEDEDARVYCHLGGVTNLAIARGTDCLFTRVLSAPWEAGADVAPALAEEIRMSINYYMAQPEARPVTGVTLSGPGSADAELGEALADGLDVPVAIAAPLGGIDVVGLPPTEDPRRHTVALGLALGAAA